MGLTGYRTIKISDLHKVARGMPRRPRPPKGVEKNLHNRFSCAKGTNIYVIVLCLAIVNVNVTKYMPQKSQI